ncbi:MULTISPECIES: ABC transporter permease [unclassified Pseudonocardia]|uniref:ABC transporter permease n=1 Tax=unclassified Pseudonocardia TaxID=2619320 RepID=UPI000761C368|nr:MULTISPECIES: ABC transporter permease [unclassified Pseudonocardia]OLM19450.1 Dipeptide transport system permease protein DppC [Pseudonocardia sp. Ae707_Ps1]
MTAAVLTPGEVTGPRPAARPRLARPLLALPFALLLVLAVVGPLLAPWDPQSVVATPSSPPSSAHWFGTDTNGMDVFSRVLTATRLDVLIALSVTVLSTLAALVVGLVTGMNEARRGPAGIAARATARGIDLVQAVPTVIGGLVLLSFFGREPLVMVLALALLLLPVQARLVRVEVLRVRSEGYVDAARMSGESEPALIVRHVLPNASHAALENTSAIFGIAVIFCAGLGFLGVGIVPPIPEWGSMLALGATDAAVGRWWGALFPALALGLAVASAAGAARALFAGGAR